MTQDHAALALGYALLPYQRSFVRLARALQFYYAGAEALGVPTETAERILQEERRWHEWLPHRTFDEAIARATKRLYDDDPEAVWVGYDPYADFTPNEFKRLFLQEWPRKPADEQRPQDSASSQPSPKVPSLPRPRGRLGGF